MGTLLAMTSSGDKALPWKPFHSAGHAIVAILREESGGLLHDLIPSFHGTLSVLG